MCASNLVPEYDLPDEAWSPKPYRALVEEWDGGRVWVNVRAIGPNDAKGVARQTAIDKGYDAATVLRVEEVAA